MTEIETGPVPWGPPPLPAAPSSGPAAAPPYGQAAYLPGPYPPGPFAGGPHGGPPGPAPKQSRTGWIVGGVIVAVLAIPIALIMMVTLLGTTATTRFVAVGSSIDPGNDPSGDPTVFGTAPTDQTVPPEATQPAVVPPGLGALTTPVSVSGRVPFTLSLPAGWKAFPGRHEKQVHVQPGSAKDPQIQLMIAGEVPYAFLRGDDSGGIYATWMPAVIEPDAFVRRFFGTDSALPALHTAPVVVGGRKGVLVDETPVSEHFLVLRIDDGILLVRFESIPIASVRRVVAGMKVP